MVNKDGQQNTGEGIFTAYSLLSDAERGSMNVMGT